MTDQDFTVGYLKGAIEGMQTDLQGIKVWLDKLDKRLDALDISECRSEIKSLDRQTKMQWGVLGLFLGGLITAFVKMFKP
jgi:hypothetical protein